MGDLKKTVYTVCTDNYFPELMWFTIPTIKAFAERIGANFELITERKFPDFPPTYEKLQVHELGRNNDWNILVDADCMIHPQMWDPTERISPTHVGHNIQFDASIAFEPDEYFLRDGRRLAVVTNFMCVSRMCHDVWTPLEFSAEVAKTKTKRWFIIDEYCVSRNLAKFGLKQDGIGVGDDHEFFQHLDISTTPRSKEEILELAEKISKQWG